ncbi:MAG: hypothetical protein GTN65_02755 [Armatimonadetes bacterium]|nr:hypothetical protein [Armatimonadota bacterium]NIO96026.1 hypothetical protein [Armatimonadota bacterium]
MALGIAFPGMLTAWWLLFPTIVARARSRIQQRPGRSFLMGLGLSIALSFPITILLALPFGPAKFVGAILLILCLGLTGLGTASIAALMADRLKDHSGGDLSSGRAFVAGAVALELAAAFPVIGWFLFIPMVTIISLGAVAFSILRREPEAPDQVVAKPVLTRA